MWTGNAIIWNQSTAAYSQKSQKRIDRSNGLAVPVCNVSRWGGERARAHTQTHTRSLACLLFSWVSSMRNQCGVVVFIVGRFFFLFTFWSHFFVLLLYVKERSQNSQTTVIGLCLFFRFVFIIVVVVDVTVGRSVSFVRFSYFGWFFFSGNIYRLLPEPWELTKASTNPLVFNILSK